MDFLAARDFGTVAWRNHCGLVLPESEGHRARNALYQDIVGATQLIGWEPINKGISNFREAYLHMLALGQGTDSAHTRFFMGRYAKEFEEGTEAFVAWRAGAISKVRDIRKAISPL